MERRGFFGKVIAVGAGALTLAKSIKARAALPSDSSAAAPGPDYLTLPGFAKDSPVTLDQALLKRATVRSYDGEARLSAEQLSRLLWAATGANRDDGHRTTPSAMAVYPVDLYVALPEGVFLFEPKKHRLKKVKSDDIRAEIPLQGAFKKAAMLALYVVNARKSGGGENNWAELEVGCMVQNLYLKAAAEGLGSAVFAIIRADRGGELLGLKSGQKLLIAQAVGPVK